jgi:hypothetical protein
MKVDLFVFVYVFKLFIHVCMCFVHTVQSDCVPEDKKYNAHLQRHLDLIISAPKCEMNAQYSVTSHRAQVDPAFEASFPLNKECSFAVLLQGGPVYMKWECNQPGFRCWCCANPHAKQRPHVFLKK